VLYRKAFGESPSETRRRAQSARAASSPVHSGAGACDGRRS
jgi:hypothetical protein